MNEVIAVQSDISTNEMSLTRRPFVNLLVSFGLVFAAGVPTVGGFAIAEILHWIGDKPSIGFLIATHGIMYLLFFGLRLIVCPRR